MFKSLTIPIDVQELLESYLRPMKAEKFDEVFRPFFDEDGNMALSVGSGSDRWLEWTEEGWTDTDSEFILLANEVLNEE